MSRAHRSQKTNRPPRGHTASGTFFLVSALNYLPTGSGLSSATAATNFSANSEEVVVTSTASYIHPTKHDCKNCKNTVFTSLPYGVLEKRP